MTAAERVAARQAEDRRRALDAVDLELRRVRETFSRAALACMTGHLHAQDLVADALAAVDHARAALREVDEKQQVPDVQ